MDIKTHDYTKRCWGHDYAITKIINDGKIISIMGWGYGLNKDDFLLLEGNKKLESTRYLIKEIKYFNNPSDMWSVLAEFSPRIKE